MAKSRKARKNRMLLELIENGIAAETRKQHSFLPWLSVEAMSRIQMRLTAWATNSAEWSSAAEPRLERWESLLRL